LKNKLSLGFSSLQRAVAIMLVAASSLTGLTVRADIIPPTITTANRTRIVGVADVNVTSGGVTRPTFNASGLVVLGDNAYAIKADTHDTLGTGWTTFYRILDYASTSPSTASYTVRMQGSSTPLDVGHANGMTYYRSVGSDPTLVGSFYIAMFKSVGSYQVAQVNATGEVTKLFKARRGTAEKKIASITHYDSGVFIVGTGGENVADPVDPDVIWKPYYLAVMSGDYFELADKFYVPTNRTYNIGQDIHYVPADDELLVPVWDGRNTLGTATGRKNRVIVVELGAIVDETKYTPKRWIDLSVSATAAKKFEFEGITRDANGKLLVTANVVKPDGVAIDGIYKITGQ
jgi:hypothetical protein